MPIVAIAALTPPSVLGTRICCCDYVKRPKPEIAKLASQRPHWCRCTEYEGYAKRLYSLHMLSTWMYPRFESVSPFRLGHRPGP